MNTSAAIKRKDVGLRLYNTPTSATRLLLDRIKKFTSEEVDGIILEPCAGERAISNVLDAHIERLNIFDKDEYMPKTYRGVRRADLNPDCQPHCLADATNPVSWAPTDDGHMTEHRYGSFDWCITNPEFNIAARVLPLALEHARVGIAMLLRLTYLEPCEDRDEWLAVHPPNHQIVLPRMSFKTVITHDTATGKDKISTTDSATCAWYCWYRFTKEQKIEIVTRAQLAEFADTEDNFEAPVIARRVVSQSQLEW